MSISVIILAAGEGKRMKSRLPKVMHKVASRTMVGHIIDLVKTIDAKEVVSVIGPNMDILREHILSHGVPIKCVVQENRLGTADAVKIGMKEIRSGGDVLVLYGDTPFIASSTISRMKILLDANSKNALVVLGFNVKGPSEYGRLIVNDKNELQAIVEYLDCDLEQREINLCNSGVMLINHKYISDLLSNVTNNNAKKEYYLTDLVEIAHSKKLICQYVAVSKEEAIAINSREELAEAEEVIQKSLREEIIKKGVTLIDKNTVYFARDTKIDSDVVIYPNVFFGTNVEVKSGVTIKSFCHLEGAMIGEGSTVGPFAHLRPGTALASHAKIGNFVEIKNSSIGESSKVSHLSYIGDSEVGKEVNIGAGTITCNYDGFAKHKTQIEDDVFVGSNVSLVAPVSIGAGSIIGAGSVITHDVCKDSLAVGRSKQQTYPDKALVMKKKKLKENTKKNSGVL